MASIPSIGRQGKALRRRQLRRSVNLQLDAGENNSKSSSKEHCDTKDPLLTLESPEVEVMKGHHKNILVEVSNCKDMYRGTECEEPYGRVSSFALFEEFSNIGLDRLGIKDLANIDILRIWKETQPFTDLMGPFWSLRAALGPLVETYLLLDRLLFLQEQAIKRRSVPREELSKVNMNLPASCTFSYDMLKMVGQKCFICASIWVLAKTIFDQLSGGIRIIL